MYLIKFKKILYLYPNYICIHIRMSIPVLVFISSNRKGVRIIVEQISIQT